MREGGRPLWASRILAPAKWGPCWISIKPTQRSLLRNYSLKLVSAWNFNLFYLNFPLMPELRQIRWICGKWKSDECDVMWAPCNNSHKGWLIYIYEFPNDQVKTKTEKIKCFNFYAWEASANTIYQPQLLHCSPQHLKKNPNCLDLTSNHGSFYKWLVNSLASAA